MAISNEKATPMLLLLLAGIVGYCAYTGTVINLVGMKGLAAGREHVAAVRDTITKFEAATDSAKKELARGSVADVRKRLENYRSSVTLSQVVPQPVSQGPAPFDTYSYNMSVIGRYDQIGQFMADVASLQRIIVPYNLSVGAANAQSAKALGDSTGSMLEAKFQVRTYVKSSSPEGEASGT